MQKPNLKILTLLILSISIHNTYSSQAVDATTHTFEAISQTEPVVKIPETPDFIIPQNYESCYNKIICTFKCPNRYHLEATQKEYEEEQEGRTVVCANDLNYCSEQSNGDCTKCIEDYRIQDVSHEKVFCSPYPQRIRVTVNIVVVLLIVFFFYLLITTVGHCLKNCKEMKSDPVKKKVSVDQSKIMSKNKMSYRQTEQAELNMEFNSKRSKKGYKIFQQINDGLEGNYDQVVHKSIVKAEDTIKINLKYKKEKEFSNEVQFMK